MMREQEVINLFRKLTNAGRHLRLGLMELSDEDIKFVMTSLRFIEDSVDISKFKRKAFL